VPPLERVQRLEDLAPVIELYHHTVRAGQYDEACTLFRDRITRATYYQFGAYQLRIELLCALFPDGEEQPPRLKKEDVQAWTLNELANSYSRSGQPRRAVPLFEMTNDIYENKMGNKHYLAIGLGNLANRYLDLGALQAAEANRRRSIALWREIEDQDYEAIGHLQLGRLLAYRGVFDEAEQHLTTAQEVFDGIGAGRTNFVSVVRAFRALRALLMGNVRAALEAARQALELADEHARKYNPVEPDYVRAHRLLGAAHRANGNMGEADRHLSQALTRCRSINMVADEADILLELARLRAATGARAEALRLAQEALLITERSGYVLQGADLHLFLAQMALEDENEETALEHAREARRLATCDGPPDYTYRVAYEEAGALLQRIESG
jgi:tetratricopeptide (TPR) repeat protein